METKQLFLILLPILVLINIAIIFYLIYLLSLGCKKCTNKKCKSNCKNKLIFSLIFALIFLIILVVIILTIRKNRKSNIVHSYELTGQKYNPMEQEYGHGYNPLSPIEQQEYGHGYNPLSGQEYNTPPIEQLPLRKLSPVEYNRLSRQEYEKYNTQLMLKKLTPPTGIKLEEEQPTFTQDPFVRPFVRPGKKNPLNKISTDITRSQRSRKFSGIDTSNIIQPGVKRSGKKKAIRSLRNSENDPSNIIQPGIKAQSQSKTKERIALFEGEITKRTPTLHLGSVSAMRKKVEDKSKTS